MKIDKRGQDIMKLAMWAILLITTFLWGDVVHPFVLEATTAQRTTTVLIGLCFTILTAGLAYFTEAKV